MTMAYFFVVGTRAGKNAEPLYVQAEDADGAKARARELGMEPSGVRSAKSVAKIRDVMINTWWFMVPIYLIYAITMVACSQMSQKLDIQVRPVANLLQMTIPIGILLTTQVQILLGERNRMQKELNELRQRLDAIQPPS